MGHSSFTFTTDGFARNLEWRQDVVSHGHRRRGRRSRLRDGTEDRQGDRPGGRGCGVFNRIAKWTPPHTGGESAAFPLNWNRTLSLSFEFMLYLERTGTDFPIRRPRKHTNGHHWGRKICPPPPRFTRILFEETYEDLLPGLEASAFGNWFKIGKRMGGGGGVTFDHCQKFTLADSR